MHVDILCLAKKDVEILPGLEPGSSECQSAALVN